MNADTKKQRLTKMLNPNVVAFVGGRSVEPAIDYTRALNFKGKIHVINPIRETLAGVPCLQSASEINEPIDVAFVSVPNRLVVDAITDLSQANTGAAVVCSSGFAEIGKSGKLLQDRMLTAAQDMPFIGPNCPGICNFLDGFSCMIDNLGVHQFDHGVAVLSNGGAYLADLSCSERSLPISYLFGMGIQASVSIAEMMQIVLEDPRVSAINLYFESIKDISKLSDCAVIAQRKNIPIVAVCVGHSTSGKRAAQSHTASMSGNKELASALFQKFGFVEVDSSSQAMETLKMLTITGSLPGRKIAFATSSGTYAVTGGDFAEQNGLELPNLSDNAKKQVEKFLPPFVNAINPLDIATDHFAPNSHQLKLFTAFLSDDFDLALHCMSFPAENTWEDESWYRSAEVFCQAAKLRSIPSAFIAPTHEGIPIKARKKLIEWGSAPLQGFHEGFTAIKQACEWFENRQSMNLDSMNIPAPPTLNRNKERFLIDELQTKQLLQQHGVKVPAGVKWNQSSSTTPPVKYPVALKLLSPAVLHKSELRAVMLNIHSVEELLNAQQAMSMNLEKRNIEYESFLVESMIVDEGVDLLVGIRNAAGFGLSLTVGAGGIIAELIHDFQTLIFPISAADVELALTKLKIYPLLQGFRGQPKMDLRAAINSIMLLCKLAQSKQNELVELEINPLRLYRCQAPVALDAVLIVQQ